jgi:DNA polymerase-3 subunit delta
LINFYQKDNPFYFSFDFSDKFLPSLEISEIKEILSSRNLFSATSLVVFKNLLNSVTTNFQKEILKIVFENKIDQAKSTMLILYENSKVKEGTLLKWLKHKVKSTKEYPLLKKRELNQWIDEEAKKSGLKLNREAKDLLMNSFESDIGLIYYALKKLSLIQKGIIDRKILEENIWLPFNTNIFSFLDTLAERKIAAAFNFLMKEIEQDNSPFHLLYLLKMIIFEFRNLLMIKEVKAKSLAEIQKKTKIHPYTLRKIYPLVKGFSLDELTKIYQKLFLCDERMKRGLMDAELALQMLLLDIKQILE